MKSYHVEPTESGKYRVTSPEDRRIHVVSSDPVKAMEIAVRQERELDGAQP